MAKDTKTTTKKVEKKKLDYTYAVGRRKTATARVRLYTKKGDLIVNKMPAGKYFTSADAQRAYMEPLKLVGKVGKFSFSAKVTGSGTTGQLGAVVHGIARALVKFNTEEFRGILKKHGLLTRDPRKKERRKVGTGGKARRSKQSPKR